jgi:hypothetical protein
MKINPLRLFRREHVRPGLRHVPRISKSVHRLKIYNGSPASAGNSTARDKERMRGAVPKKTRERRSPKREVTAEMTIRACDNRSSKFLVIRLRELWKIFCQRTDKAT